MADSDYSASELRKRYLRGGSIPDDQLSSAQVRARHAVPKNRDDFSTGDSEGDSYNKIAVGLVVLLVLCIGIYYFYLADKS